MAKRRKTKYPNLDTNYNTKSRRDYIETDYIDGVKNAKGELVIRPLNDSEKEWLNQYYGEFVAFSDVQLNPTDEIKEMMKEKSDCKKRIAQIRREEKLKINDEIRFLQDKIVKLEECLDFLREEAGVFASTCEEQRKLYTMNNNRNFCLYNNRKARGMLIDLTFETYDSFIARYWDSLKTFGYDSQDLLIETVESELRAEGFLGEEPELEDTD